MYARQMIKIIWILLATGTVAFAEYGYDDSPGENYDEPKRTIPAKQVIIQNRKSITALKRQIADLKERVSGMASLIEGLNGTIAEMKNTPSTSTTPVNSTENTKLLKELGLMIDKINENYVSKEELQKLLNGKKLSPHSRKKQNKTSTLSQSDTFDGKSTAKIYSEGVRLFVKQRYDEAAKRFTLTDKKGYKPAASNYYLGESAYYTKQYEDAIFFYKKSASLYDQASYIDVLLLHTAVSLEKTGDKAQAKTFYKNIIENYPNKKSAAIAKKKMKSL